MNELNMKLKDVEERIQEQEIKQKQLDHARKAKEEDISSYESLIEQLKKEERDVEQLEKLTLVNLFHTLKNDKVEKMDQEVKEVMEVKGKIDRLKASIDFQENEIKQLKEQMVNMTILKEERRALLEKKKALIEQEKPGVWQSYEALEHKISHFNSELKEIREAVHAGQSSLSSVRDVKSSLKSAANWGTYDMIGGGMIATMAKHGHMEDAQKKLHTLSSQLTRFNRELNDVGQSIKSDISLDGFMSFADYFFDGLFVDWAVQSQIEKAQNKIYGLETKINQLLSQLNASFDKAQREIEQLKNEQENLIVSA